jgi:hypothetical protein
LGFARLEGSIVGYAPKLPYVQQLNEILRANHHTRVVTLVLNPMLPKSTHPKETFDRLARRAFFGFILTFIISRASVFLIMSGRIPNMYFFLHGTHVHHLNYGIFLLAIVGAYALFWRPDRRAAEVTALIYGLAMGLTFDEFGMWLHLGGSYWQRASVDAVIVVAAVIGLIAYAPSLERLERRHFRAFAVLLIVVVGFVFVVFWSGGYLGGLVGPKLRELELSASP